MTTLYWVGGDGTWDATNTHWSIASGGAGGSGPPTTSDVATFNSDSGNAVVTISSSTAQSLNCTGFTGTLSGSTIVLWGNVTLSPTMTITSTLRFNNNTCTLTSNGCVAAGVYVGSSFAHLVLGDNLSCSFLQAGDFTTNNHNVSASNYISLIGGTSNLGSSIITLTGTGGFISNNCVAFNAGTSTIRFTDQTNATKLFQGGGQTYYILDNEAAGALQIETNSGLVLNNTFHTIQSIPGGTILFKNGTTQTITTSLLVSGSSCDAHTTLNSTSPGSLWYISSPVSLSNSYLTIQDSTTVGNTPFSALQSTSTSNNVGWTFTACSPVVPGTGLSFAEERQTTYHDWVDYRADTGCDYDSYFISGFKIHGQMKNWNPMYVYFVSKYHSDSSWLLRALWDFTNSALSNRWSAAQQGFRDISDRGWTHSRLKIRGNGPALQFKVNSEEGKPFYIAGWSSFETLNAAP